VWSREYPTGLRAVALASGFKRGEFIGDTKLSPTIIRCHHHHPIAHEKIGPPNITWVDELPSMLWSLRTTPNAATQETPFFLVHGTEAMLPVEITHEAPRIAAYDETTSTEAFQDDVDALNEARDVALARPMQYQQNL
jgi:hypothetical protein